MSESKYYITRFRDAVDRLIILYQYNSKQQYLPFYLHTFDRNLISHTPTVWQRSFKIITKGYKEPTDEVFSMSQSRRAQLLVTGMTFDFPMNAVFRKHPHFVVIEPNLLMIVPMYNYKTRIISEPTRCARNENFVRTDQSLMCIYLS